MLFIIILGLCSLLLLVLGIRIRNGKNLNLLSWYRFIPKEDIIRLDNKGIARASGNMMLRLAIALFVFGLAIHFKIVWLSIALLVLIILDPCITTVYLYHRNSRVKAFKKSAIIVVATTILTFAAIGFIFTYGDREPEITLLDNSIQIKSMYGLDVYISDIKGIHIVEKSMGDIGVDLRTNGYSGFSGIQKGHFRSENRGMILLFVASYSTPTIWIERIEQKDIFISYADSNRTMDLYRRLIDAYSEKLPR